MGDRERLYGYLEGSGKMILVEPGALLTEASRMPGLDGQKMSKSYGNTIFLREGRLAHQEDPHHADRPGAGPPHRSGRPEKCPVWQFHVIYSDDSPATG
jgi:tryptophanyl-tRNA synthetase